MKNTLVKLDSNRPHEGPCAAFDDAYLYISFMAEHKTFDDLKNAAKKAKIRFSTYAVVELKTIEEITCNLKAKNFFFHYERAGKQKKYGLEISDHEMRLTFCKELALASGLKTKTETNNPYSRLGQNLIPIIMIGLLTLGCYLGASGKLIDLGSAKSRAISEAFEAIGPTAFLIIGLSFIGFFVFRMVKNIKASDLKIVYSF